MAEERLSDDPLKKGLEDEFVDIELEGTPEELEGASEDADENYDEDLVGLTPTKLKAELEKRRLQEEKANKEKKHLLETAAEKRARGQFEEAASFYEQAMVYGEDCELAVWECRTEEYESIECFHNADTSHAFSCASPETREKVLKKVEGRIREEIAECEAEATPLREKVEAGINLRREAFRANRNYYLVRVLIALGVLVLFAIGAVVAGGYIFRTKDMVAPILTGVFGFLALASFGVALFFSRGLLAGQKLMSDNERLSATEDGARLVELQNRIESLTLALTEQEDESLETPYEFSEE